MLVETRYEHIAVDDTGLATIVGTSMKVKELVAERLAWGWSPEELLINHPHLTLGQIFSALAYYADHPTQNARPYVMALTFYLDEHIPNAITVDLRARGVDILTVQEDERRGIDDPVLLDRAGGLGRIMVSFDADLLRKSTRRQREGESFVGVAYRHQTQMLGLMYEKCAGET